MTFNRYLVIFLFSVVLALPVSANYQDQVNLEQSFTNKAQHVLDTMYGKHRFAVSTTVDLGREQWRVRYTGKAKVSSGAKQKTPKNYQILPGYSAIRNLVPNEASVPYNSEVTKVSGNISRITMRIITSREVTRRDVRRAEKILKSLLKFNDRRGDKIEFVFEDFPVVAAQASEGDAAAATAAVASGGDDFQRNLLILLGILGVLYVFFQMRQLRASKQAASAVAAAAGGGGSSAPAMPDLSGLLGGASSGASDSPGMKHYFNFVSAGNIDNVISILKSEKLGAQHIGVVVSFLPGALAGKVLQSLSIPDQAAIMQSSLDPKVLDKGTIEKIEDRVRTRLECMVGGQSVVEDIFGHLSNDKKKGILQVLRKSPADYKKIRANVLIFDDLGQLTGDEIKLVVSELNLDRLSAALMGADESTYQKVFQNLSGSAKAMITQFKELKGASISADDVDSAQNYVLEVVGRLDRDGKVSLRSKLGGGAAARAKR